MGLVAPAPGFLEGLRAECDRVGALLIFDEVITGFRRRPRRRPGAVRRPPRPQRASARSSAAASRSAPSAVGPTSWTCSRRSAPCTRPARCRGTRSPPPPGWPRSACSTTDAYAELDRAAERFAAAARGRRFGDAGLAGAGARASAPLVGLFFGADAADRLRRGPARPTRRLYAAFFHAMLDRGVALAPGAYEVLFPGLAHTDDVLDEVVAVAADAAAAVAAHLG